MHTLAADRASHRQIKVDAEARRDATDEAEKKKRWKDH